MDITGRSAADNDTLQRRQSTAARIVIGREEIERFGDSNVGDVLKRLPGVTVGGAPGRGGGGPRMRGLGSGYTQLLINGEPIPAGFSLESLTPDQVERIEVLRAPTAEYGTRAIAGTINIVLREALQRRLNDLRLSTSVEHGRASPNLSWTRNDRLAGPPGSAYNLSLSAFRRHTTETLETITTQDRLADDAPLLRQRETGQGVSHREGLNLTGRLQWRLGPADSLTLQPVLFTTRGGNREQSALVQTLGASPPAYASSDTQGDSRFSVARASLQWQQRLGEDTRLDLRIGGGGFDAQSHVRRRERDAAGALLRTRDDDSDTRERSLNSIGKLSHELASEHRLVGGWDLEAIRREEQRLTRLDGQSLLGGTGDAVDARTRRLALYLQDEWNPSRQWSAYAGLRWERIDTRSDDPLAPVDRASAVWTPLLQAVWKPHEKSRDQVRLALTRSYKAPALRNLIARPQVSSRAPAPGPNTPTTSDFVGNPGLRPELATGLDLAYEHYLGAGGLVSVSLFHRRISNLMRSVVSSEPQAVPWANVPRYVTRVENIGDAVTQGLELEAKGRLDEFVADLPPVSLRSNLSLFRSRVEGVPGPDNRLDEQPAATANLGADYRFRGWPLQLGGNLNWTPDSTVQRSANQRQRFSRKRTFEAFATWTFSPALALRLAANNLLPRDYVSATTVEAGGVRETSEQVSPTAVQWTLRLEMKL
ncbi:TonB-dependent receptor plug domain-containing protein [Piscinibacter sakaiensis]|uniref:TonB-dependent receptor n=1 Tax=Piscinibacter sakaiensis TaxID=1547922 RepID=A0A0K8NY55_PISS1|nr:TonB-dependent receptor [Piscinibacter sakaiensis]GAP35337.1 TonB-dependent receptor [Piscinibacter sakaiensis]